MMMHGLTNPKFKSEFLFVSEECVGKEQHVSQQFLRLRGEGKEIVTWCF
jgi:hypothetical protein